MKAFVALTHTPLGFEPDHVFALNVSMPHGAYPNWQARLNEKRSHSPSHRRNTRH